MEKPAGWDTTEAKSFTQIERPPAGAYVFTIVKAAADVSKEKKRPMLVLLLDIDEGPFKGHFRKLFEYLKTGNPQAKWPLVHRRSTDGDQTAYYKGDITAIEESNPGFVYNHDERGLTSKKVGGVLQEKEINAEGKTILEPYFLCSAGKARVGGLKAPPVKKFIISNGGGYGFGGEGFPQQNQSALIGASNDFYPPQEDLPF